MHPELNIVLDKFECETSSVSIVHVVVRCAMYQEVVRSRKISRLM